MSSGGAPDKRGTSAEVPAVLSMDHVGLRRRVQQPPLGSHVVGMR